MGTLYLVATPIGNLEDMTARAVRVLRDAGLIAAEDTRSARRLLTHFGIKPPAIISYNDHNARARIPALIAALGEADVAVVSDAGMPGISDPGHALVVAAIEARHVVVPIPGASAVLSAVAASGLPSRRFHYLGFLPRQAGPRRAALREASRSGDTLVVFESPHRIQATLQDVLATLGDRRVAVARELTKLHEEIWRGPVSAAIGHFAEPRGEFTLVIEGGAAAADDTSTSADVDPAIAELRAGGMRAKDGIAEIMRRFGLSKREAYRRWHLVRDASLPDAVSGDR